MQEFWRSACSAQRTSFSVVASCGLLPRTTRPGPRRSTAYPAVAILPLRDTSQSWTWSAPRWTNVAPTARALATPSSRGCGLATDQKAVRRRGPGRVVLGSKPQLATTEKLVRWAGSKPQLATTEELVRWAEHADCQKKLVRWAGRASAKKPCY